jgi:hypothetical protein
MARYLPVLVLLLGVTSLGAGPPEDQKVQVKVLAILASEHHKEVSPKLAEFARHVQKKDKALTGFKLDRTTDLPMKLGETKEFPLVGKEVVEIKVNPDKTEEGRIILTITPPKMGPITYACACDVYFPIATHHYVGKGKDKERLFIAIMAKPCVPKPKPAKK